MDNTRRYALKAVSRVAKKVEPKSANVLSQIAGANFGDPDNLASMGALPGPFPAKETRPVYRGTLVKHGTAKLAIDVLTESRHA